MDYIKDIAINKAFPKLTPPTSEDDKLAILFCEITVWECQQKDGVPDLFTKPDKYIRLQEVTKVTIKKTYKELIQKASIVIPRGAVFCAIDNTKPKNNQDGAAGQKAYSQDVKVGSENAENAGMPQSYKEATANADFTTSLTQSTGNNVSVYPISVTMADDGLVKVVRENTEQSIAPNSVSTGNRVEIRMTYAYSDEEYQQLRRGEARGKLEFTGVITKCSVNEPLTIECEDLASYLKKAQCPDLKAAKNYTVKDFLSPNGQFKMLDKTGIELATLPGVDINVGKIGMTKNLVVADVLSEWSKCGIFCYMEDEDDGHSKLRVGRSYVTNVENYDYKDSGNVMKAVGDMNIVRSDWDVAKDGLKVSNIDKAYLAVEATGIDANGKYFKVTVRKDPEDNTKFQVINERKATSRKAMKKNQEGDTSNANMPADPQPGIDLSKYTIVPHFPQKVGGITKDELIKSAEDYWSKYNVNGISGVLTLFGDRNIHITDTIAYIDYRFPERSGYYFVESVETVYGVSEGYRKNIKIPYKVARIKWE